MATRKGKAATKATKASYVNNERSVGTIFPEVRLKRLKASKTVLSMTPTDFRDMEKAVVSDERVDNKKVQALTTQDLITLESLFSDYRMEIISNYQVGTQLSAAKKKASGDSCCCCCTPCCCCAATETDPFAK
jgi:hypothetical protein